MPWKMRLVETKEGWNSIAVGDCWFAPDTPKERGSVYYQENNSDRPVLYVLLPAGPFMVDSPASNDPSRKGWIVKGTPPDITLEPSINMNSGDKAGGYHGWIRDGIITDDCEGRVYENSEYRDLDTNRIPA